MMAVYVDGSIDCSCDRTICNPDCHVYSAKKKTNGDRIRSMMDEELAEWMSANARKYTSLSYSETGVIEDYGDHGLIAKRWIDWLKEEATK